MLTTQEGSVSRTAPRSPRPLCTMSEVTVRPAESADVGVLARIYNHYIRNSISTFEEVEVAGEELELRVAAVTSAALPWLVACSGEKVVGYAYASPWKGRSAYRFTVESTVYLDPGCRRRGIGARLYAELLRELGDRGLHSAIGGIALPNPASVRLHEACGFTKVAHFEQVGFKFDQWVDVGYWQWVDRAHRSTAGDVEPPGRAPSAGSQVQ